MRLSPLDIKKQEFSRTMRRGYDPDEVHAFNDMLAGQWSDLLAEQRRTEDKVRELKAKMSHYEKVEEALQEALSTARESSQQTLENARQEAVLIVKKANAKAEDIARDVLRRRDELHQQAGELLTRRDEIVVRLRAFLRAEAEMLERYEDRNTDVNHPRRHHAGTDDATAEPASAVAAIEPAQEEKAQDPTPEVGAPAAVPLDAEEFKEGLQEVTDVEPVAAEIEVEVIEKAPAPKIEVEVIDEAPVKRSKARKNKKAPAPVGKKPSPSFSQEDAPHHFADDEEPLSFTFFGSNDEEDDPAKLLTEGEETPPFASVHEDASRKNGRPPRSEDRAPADSTWIVRPVVSSTQARATGAAASNANQSDEIDKIRRILSDLD